MNKVLLIDGDSLIYYEAFKEQPLEKAIEGINKRLLHMCKENNTNRYVGFLTKGGCFRYGVAKSLGYKSGRPIEKPELLYQLTNYLLESLHFQVEDGLEADDLVAYWNNVLKEETIICSPDKDVLKQIAGTHYNYRWTAKSRGSFVTTTPVEAEKFLWQQVLMGDSTDSIPGLPGVGEKKALKIIESVNLTDNNYYEVVLDHYILAFGTAEGVSRFAETFKLVYMLRTPEDVKREIGRELIEPKVKVVM